MTRIRKAVFPVAGLGTRFLPATKVIPKEMLPIVDTPQIQVAVQEAVDSGIEEMIFITGRGKVSVVDHFDVSFELEDHLLKRGQDDLLNLAEEISRKARIVSVRQKRPLGLGHAVLCAKEVVGDEPFVVFLSDDVIQAQKPVVKQLCEVYERHGASVLAVMEVPNADVSRYGVITPSGAPAPEEGVIPLEDMVEKPSPAEAPSNMAIIGRYVLDPDIFSALERVKPDAKGEIQLTDGLRLLLKDKPILAYVFEGKRYDAGSKLGFLQATVEFALLRDDLGPAFRDFLRGLKL